MTKRDAVKEEEVNQRLSYCPCSTVIYFQFLYDNGTCRSLFFIYYYSLLHLCRSNCFKFDRPANHSIIIINNIIVFISFGPERVLESEMRVVLNLIRLLSVGLCSLNPFKPLFGCRCYSVTFLVRLSSNPVIQLVFIELNHQMHFSYCAFAQMCNPKYCFFYDHLHLPI